jgi:hypothetical protein
VPTQKGDLLLWSLIGHELLDAPGSLTKDEVMNVVVSHHDELATCTALGKKDGELHLGWKVSAEGVPYDIAAIGSEFAADPSAKCITKALAAWRFPRRKAPTLHIDFPIKLQR